MVGNKHAFFGTIFLDKDHIIGYTYNGAMYKWDYDAKDSNYKSAPIVHGHFNIVSDLDWDNSSSLLLTTSKDQTTRIFGHWKDKDYWYEFNRPQIHGYDLNSISFVYNKTNDLINKIASGADEKIIRLFEPSFSLIKFVENLSKKTLRFNETKDNQYYEKCN